MTITIGLVSPKGQKGPGGAERRRRYQPRPMFVDSVIIGIINIVVVAVTVIVKSAGGSLPGTDQQVVDHLHDGGIPGIGARVGDPSCRLRGKRRIGRDGDEEPTPLVRRQGCAQTDKVLYALRRNRSSACAMYGSADVRGISSPSEKMKHSFPW